MKWCKTHADWQANYLDEHMCRWAVVVLGSHPEKSCQLTQDAPRTVVDPDELFWDGIPAHHPKARS